MEDLLDLYQLPYDPRYPVVGMDEMPKQLIAETRIPLPACEGHPVLYDYEYERKGVCNLFLSTIRNRARMTAIPGSAAPGPQGVSAVSSWIVPSS